LQCEKETFYIVDVGKFVLDSTVYTAFNYVWSLLGFVLPVLTLIYCNVYMVRALRESRRMRRMYAVNASVPTSCGSRVTLTLVAVVCMYLVLITPSELMQFYYYIVRRDAVELFNTAIVAANVLQTTNFSFNFVLYCIVNVHFRKTWKKLIYCSFCRRWCGRSRGRDGSIEERQLSTSFRRHPTPRPSADVNMSSSSRTNSRRLHHQHSMSGRSTTTAICHYNRESFNRGTTSVF